MPETYDPSNAPQIPPRPIIICNRCTWPFDCRRKVDYDPNRCPRCGELNPNSEIIVDRVYMDEHINDIDSNGRQLYVMQDSEKNIKIGISENMDSRRSSVAWARDDEVEVVATWELSNPKKIERELHKQLSGVNVGGEWFKLQNRSLSGLIDSISIVVDRA